MVKRWGAATLWMVLAGGCASDDVDCFDSTRIMIISPQYTAVDESPAAGTQVDLVARVDLGPAVGLVVAVYANSGAEFSREPVVTNDDGVLERSVTIPDAGGTIAVWLDRAGCAGTGPRVALSVVEPEQCFADIVQPATIVHVDADADPSNGAQLDVEWTDFSCESYRFEGCEADGLPYELIGASVARVTMCETLPCEAARTCTLTYWSLDGVYGASTFEIKFDDLPPSVMVDIRDPADVACGDVLTNAADIDPASDGIQLAVAVVSSGAVSRSLEVLDDSGVTSHEVTALDGTIIVTLADGASTLTAIAVDEAGNAATSEACPLTLTASLLQRDPPR